jgi:CRISPR-associated protein Cas2
MFALIAYDVETSKTEKYRKLLAKYLPSIQNSVFAGDITEVKLRVLKKNIESLMSGNDKLLFLTTENRRNVVVEEVIVGKKHTDISHLGTTII